MYRRMLIEILDLFHEALTNIQHAQNCPDCPLLPVNELRNRIISANDSFVAMAVSEIWESVDSTLKAVNLCKDYCDYLDAHVVTPKMLRTWAGHYRKAASCIDQIYVKLYSVSIHEYALF